ncbi:MAG: hypothetical protein AAF532_15755 [Planctomycetota bacterium]
MNFALSACGTPSVRRDSPFILHGWRRGLVFAIAVASGVTAAAADEITLRTDSGVGVVRSEGEVVEMTGTEVVLSTPAGRRTFDADRLVELKTSRTEPHRRALAAIADREYAAAADALEDALRAEPRAWMRRQILAARVRVLLALGDRPAAGDAFLSLLDSDPTSADFPLIPLPWALAAPSREAAASARGWIEEPGEPARLLGAAVLIGSARDRVRASTVLDELAVSLDGRIYHLARAQLWRGRLFEDSPARIELTNWETRIGATPHTLRGGPYHLLGLASAKLGEFERAAAAHLHAATVYPDDVRRAAEDGRLAAAHLRALGRAAEADAVEAEFAESIEN